MRGNKIIAAQPHDLYFLWQTHLFVESCLENGWKEEDIHLLIYKPSNSSTDAKWNILKEHYPNLGVYFYEDNGVENLLGIYIPVLRPHIIHQHFLAFPELEKSTIIYTDCDILWTGRKGIDELLQDDICYVSNAYSYMNATYFDNKINDCLPEKKEALSKVDVVDQLANIVGIDSSIIRENNLNTGGVQYILKDIPTDFWRKVQEDCISIRMYLMTLNRKFFASESRGYQSWCSDLWAMQYNLWKYNKETKVVPELAFAWAPDNIKNLEEINILHNAGIASTEQGGYPCFYKGKYVDGSNPFIDPHLDVILNNEESKKHCTWYYAKKLRELSNKYPKLLTI